MKILVTGVNGQLGHDVMLELARRGHTAIGSGSAAAYRGTDEVRDMPYVQLNITDAAEAEKVICSLKPDAVIHCSAWTAVDAAEDAANRPEVYALNVTGTQNIAAACLTADAKMVYISTDYVFSGLGIEPWRPDCTNFAPINYYGVTKLLGEHAVENILRKYFIIRTAWVFGRNGNNFVRTMVNIGRNHDSVRVVDDQIGTPTYAKDLARLIADMTETEKYGIYHATNGGGYISWCDFAGEIYRLYGLPTEIIPVTTEEYGLSAAARPLNSRLDSSKLKENGFEPLPDWKDALSRYFEEAGL